MFGIQMFLAKSRMTKPDGTRVSVQVLTRICHFTQDPYRMVQHRVVKELKGEGETALQRDRRMDLMMDADRSEF